MAVVSELVKRESLRDLLRANSPLLIAYSGGRNTAFILATAAQILKENCRGVIG